MAPIISAALLSRLFSAEIRTDSCKSGINAQSANINESLSEDLQVGSVRRPATRDSVAGASRPYGTWPGRPCCAPGLGRGRCRRRLQRQRVLGGAESGAVAAGPCPLKIEATRATVDAEDFAALKRNLSDGRGQLRREHLTGGALAGVISARPGPLKIEAAGAAIDVEDFPAQVHPGNTP